MKRVKKQWLRVLLWVAMLVGIICTYAVGADGSLTAEQVGGYFKANDETGELETALSSEAETKSYADGLVLTNKTIKAGEEENEFLITLDVRTTSELANIEFSEDAAVVIVLDLSNSMKDGNQLASAQEAAKAFISSFAATEDEDAVRKIAVVGFSGQTSSQSSQGQEAAKTYKGWTDASDNTISEAIDRMSANGGTCLQAGLILAKNLLISSEVSDITNKNIVVLTDGTPTYYLNDDAQNDLSTESIGSANQILGTGSTTTHDTHEQTENTAKSIVASGINVYSICLGDYTVECSGDGNNNGECYLNTSGANWLREYCGFITYSTEDLDKLSEMFQTISELISLQARAWIATDPMGGMFEFAGFSENPTDENEYYYNHTDDSITWNLRLSEPVDENEYYVYRLTYTVKLNTLASDYSAQTYYPTNGVTSVTYFVEQEATDGTGTSQIYYGTAYFNVPSAQGYAAEISFSKVDEEGAPLSGAEFTLTTEDDPDWSMTAVSDENGNVTFSNVPSGHTYTLEETSAPSGYIKSDETYTVTVSYGVVTAEIGTDGMVANVAEIQDDDPTEDDPIDDDPTDEEPTEDDPTDEEPTEDDDSGTGTPTGSGIPWCNCCSKCIAVTGATTSSDSSTGDTVIILSDEDSGTATTESPQTGDYNNIGFWFTVMLAASAAMTEIILCIGRKKHGK